MAHHNRSRRKLPAVALTTIATLAALGAGVANSGSANAYQGRPMTARTTLSNGCTVSARGIPSCGVFVGAAVGGNASPTTLESQLGRNLGVHRTYYTASGVASAVATAKADIAAGRLPWLSFKLPYSWADMAAGKGDSWARGIATQLAALPGPVWVAFHHEPEGDGTMSDWTAMQEHLAPLVRAAAPNVGYTVILTGWDEFYGPSQYSLATIWPKTKIDVAGFDIYQKYGTPKSDGTLNTGWTSFSTYYSKIQTWAASVGVKWGLAETGITDLAQTARPTEIQNDVNLMKQYGGIAYSYFDSTLNSVADWDLSMTAKENAFGQAITGSPSLPH